MTQLTPIPHRPQLHRQLLQYLQLFKPHTHHQICQSSPSKLIYSWGPSIKDVFFEGEGGGGVKSEILRRYLGLKLGRQGEGGGLEILN